jgi:hypothetical protein
MIKHEKGKWILYTKDGKKILGMHASEADAMAQERVIEMAKHQTGESRAAGGAGSGNFGHGGRPGEVGGSGESEGGDSKTSREKQDIHVESIFKNKGLTEDYWEKIGVTPPGSSGSARPHLVFAGQIDGVSLQAAFNTDTRRGYVQQLDPKTGEFLGPEVKFGATSNLEKAIATVVAAGPKTSREENQRLYERLYEERKKFGDKSHKRVLGGAGSGNFGHGGRPGEVGGSGESSGEGKVGKAHIGIAEQGDQNLSHIKEHVSTLISYSNSTTTVIDTLVGKKKDGVYSVTRKGNGRYVAEFAERSGKRTPLGAASSSGQMATKILDHAYGRHASNTRLNREQVKKICSSCAEEMEKKNITEISVEALVESPRFLEAVREMGGAGSGNFGHGGRPGEVGGSGESGGGVPGSADKSIAEGRKHEGFGGSPIPVEGDRVKIMGKVGGAGKKGIVGNGSSDGRFVYVKTEKGESLGSYHVSDLKVLSAVDDVFRASSLHTGSSSAKATHILYEGRQHLKVPVVALVEGVLHASNADDDERVLSEDMLASLDAWEGMPFTMDHPQMDGRRLSASDPEIKRLYSFGFVRNAHMSEDGKRLLMDAILDPERAALVGKKAVRLMERAEAGETVDVSVGVFVGTEDGVGEYNGKRYATTWRGIRPDHLAGLPEGVNGACSLEMGCGLPRAASEGEMEERELGGAGSGNFGHGGRPGEVGGSGESIGEGKSTSGIPRDQFGFNKKEYDFSKKMSPDIEKVFGKAGKIGGWGKVGKGSFGKKDAEMNVKEGGKTYKLTPDSSISVGGVAVHHNGEYIQSGLSPSAVANIIYGHAHGDMEKVGDYWKVSRFEHRKASEASVDGGTDVEIKETEGVVKRVLSNLFGALKTAVGEPETEMEQDGLADEDNEIDETEVLNQEGEENMADKEEVEQLKKDLAAKTVEVETLKAASAQPLSEEQYMKLAPESVRLAVAESQERRAKEAVELIAQIRAASDTFTEDELAKTPIEQLRKLAAHGAKIKPVPVDQSGRGVPREAAASDEIPPAPDEIAMYRAARAKKTA